MRIESCKLSNRLCVFVVVKEITYKVAARLRRKSQAFLLILAHVLLLLFVRQQSCVVTILCFDSLKNIVKLSN